MHDLGELALAVGPHPDVAAVEHYVVEVDRRLAGGGDVDDAGWGGWSGEQCSRSRHLAVAALTRWSLPAAVPVAGVAGLTWVSIGPFHLGTRLALEGLIRTRGQVARGVEVPVDPGAAAVAHVGSLGQGGAPANIQIRPPEHDDASSCAP